MVAVGFKRHRMGVLTRSGVSENRGDMNSETWAVSFTRFASIEPIRGREYLAQDRTKSEATHRIRMRYDSQTSTITARNRLRQGSNDYQIISPPINSGSRNRELEIMVKLIE